MALDDKKYEKFYKTDGSGDDKVKAADLANAEAIWDLERASGCELYLADEDFGPLIYQLQQMQDEITALRAEISANKDKNTFPGLGTSSSTALAGNTTVISSGQASAITANTAKTGISTSQAEAIGANTKKTGITLSQANAITANTAKVSLVGGTKTALSFGEMITVIGKGKTPTSYSIVMTAVNKGVSKSVTLTLT